jgi:hypothetical protein
LNNHDLNLLNEHVRYELDMLFETSNRLNYCDIDDDVVRNALIESFCIHARQLIDFFNDEKGVHARRFMNDGHSVSSSTTVQLSGKLKTKLNTQIAHLTERRTTDPADKIGNDDRSRLVSGIQKALRVFESQLRSPFKEAWGSYEIPTLPCSVKPSATNAVTISSTNRIGSASPRTAVNSLSVNPRTVTEK